MRNWFLDQIAMYAAYHRNVLNRVTHFIGVPSIIFSILVLAALVPAGELVGMPFTLAAVLSIALIIFYLAGWQRIGLVAIFALLVLLILARLVIDEGTNYALIVFAVCFIGGWALQFIGHVFERRKPALFDNLTQILIAPAFLIAEALFAFGQESDLKEEIRRRRSRYEPASGRGDER